MIELLNMSEEIRGIIPQERDFAILRGFYESRLMTIDHAAKLYFDKRLEAARKRMQKLKKAGLIRNRVQGYSEPAAMLLTKRGYEFLKHHDRLDGYPIISDAEFEYRSRVSALTLRHELAVMDVKTAFVTALSRLPNVRIIECSTWPRLSQFRTCPPSASGYGTTEVVVKPDGFLCIHERDADGVAEHNLFLEIDRGTESQRVFAEKAVCYRNHYRSGGFAESQGGSRDEYEEYPFRVLAIFKTVERRDNATERLLSLDPPIKTMLWLTTMPEVLRDLLGPIWVRPMDYQEIVAGSGYEKSDHRHVGYRRQMGREGLVEQAIIKRPLL